MVKSKFFSILCATVLLMVSTATNAELIDRGGGLIYDTDQDLTWTQNASMFAGSWDAAMAWAENLVYGGVGGWRLPSTTQYDDPSCLEDVRAWLWFEHHLGCTGGEMERLTAAHDPYNNDLFKDALGNRTVNRTRYWTSTPYRDWVDPCVGYPDTYDVECTLGETDPETGEFIVTDDGDRTNFYWQWGFWGFQGDEAHKFDPFKTTLEKGNGRYAWAVHDGDVGAPTSLPGDINFDGQVNVADYLLLTQFVLETGPTPTTAEFDAGDMNQNGDLDAGDLVILSRTVMGLI
jgi:hypothetical protein